MLSNVAQLGAPVNVYWAAVGAGFVVPATVTWKWPDCPVVIRALLTLVIVGATRLRLSFTVKLCVAAGLTPFVTVIVNVDGVLLAMLGTFVKSS